MNGKDIHNAVEYVGVDLIHRAETQRYARPIWQTLIPAAAMVALLFGIGTFLTSPAQPPELSGPAAPVTAEEPLQAEPPKTDVSAVHPLIEQFPMLKEIPATLEAETDWSTFYLNEAGLDDHGTDFYTIHGDQVLAVDAKNEILLVRVKGEDYQGVLAIANDPTKLSLQASSQIGTSGETIGTIAEAHHGVLAVNASRFADDSNGAYPQLYTMCDGIVYNEDLLIHDGQARLEIDSQGQFSVVSPAGPLGDDVQHAVQGIPSMIIDGVITNELEGWNGLHPRSCIGQTEDKTILILVIEGRMTDRSLGAGLLECAETLARYGAVQAMSLDYGTSSILWYDGEYVTKCSVSILTEGRELPNAFVVARAE